MRGNTTSASPLACSPPTWTALAPDVALAPDEAHVAGKYVTTPLGRAAPPCGEEDAAECHKTRSYMLVSRLFERYGPRTLHKHTLNELHDKYAGQCSIVQVIGGRVLVDQAPRFSGCATGAKSARLREFACLLRYHIGQTAPLPDVEMLVCPPDGYPPEGAVESCGGDHAVLLNADAARAGVPFLAPNSGPGREASIPAPLHARGDDGPFVSALDDAAWARSPLGRAVAGEPFGGRARRPVPWAAKRDGALFRGAVHDTSDCVRAGRCWQRRSCVRAATLSALRAAPRFNVSAPAC